MHPIPGCSSTAFRVPALALVAIASTHGMQEGEGGAQGERQDPLQEAVEPPEGGPDVLELDIEEALRMAMESNLDLDVERLVTEQALYDALGSWGAFDPVFFLEGALRDRQSPGVSDLSGASVLEEDSQELTTRLTWPIVTGAEIELGYSRTNEKTNNTFATFDVSTTDVVSASLTQPLLRGGWRRYATARQREAEVNLRIQEEREREVRSRVLRDVYDAYWDLVSAREEVKVRELAKKLGEEQLSRDERRLQVGTGTEVDVLQARTNVAQQEESLIQARHERLTAEDDLRRMLFQRPESDPEGFLELWQRPIRPVTPLPEVEGEGARELDWQDSLERALQSRPELKQDRYAIDVAEIRLDAASSDRLPQLDFDFSATAVGFASDPGEAFDSASSYEFPEYRGALVFSFPLGNRTASNAVRAARAEVRRSRLAYGRRELDVLAEVRAAIRDVTFRRESVLAAGTSLELARRQLEAEQARLDIGLSTTFQVLEFQQDLAEALSAERAARAAYAKAWASLAYAEGRIEQDPRFGGDRR